MGAKSVSKIVRPMAPQSNFRYGLDNLIILAIILKYIANVQRRGVVLSKTPTNLWRCKGVRLYVFKTKLQLQTKKNNFSLFQGIKSVVIASTILTEKLDWLHFGFATPALEREFIGRAMGAKVAVSFRGFDLNQTPLSDHNIYKSLWPNIDKVHSISHYLIDKGVELGLDKNTPFQIITPAIDGNRFSSKTDLRKSNTILLVSRLHWIKGIEYVLEAISEVKKRISDISVTIVGEGEERERLIFAAYQLGILKQINFVGKQEHNNIQDFMQTNEVFIQYSHQEGF